MDKGKSNNGAAMTAGNVQDSGFETRVRANFSRQTLMKTIGASMSKVVPGEVEIVLPFRHDLAQQHGYLHAGVVTAIVDTACGYAALSLMPKENEVLSIEFKINFLSPAKGDRLIARGRVTRSGRTITVCAGEVFALNDETETLVATMLATMIAVPGS
jgi:uncharacterized protein (TIGR00369 family)